MSYWVWLIIAAVFAVIEVRSLAFYALFAAVGAAAAAVAAALTGVAFTTFISNAGPNLAIAVFTAAASTRRRRSLAAAAVAGAATWASLPVAVHPEDVGFSSARLDRTRAALKADVDSSRLPGAILLVARNGKIAFYEPAGFQDRAARTAMRKDAIFPIASMSKPITTVAAMILAEENKLDLAAPVAQYLPEFRDVKVGTEGAAPKRPMTVQDLM